MLQLSCLIRIKDGNNDALDIPFVNKVEIDSSWKNVTDTAKVILPRKINVFKPGILGEEKGAQVNINTILKRGSKIEIYLGYDGNLKLEFKGYVARVEAAVPVVIDCEDEMWQLKQTNYRKSFRSISLKELIAFIWKGKSVVADRELGAITFNNKSAAYVLDELRSQGVRAYFKTDPTTKEPVLYAGFAYDFKNAERVRYNFRQNVIENELKFRLKQDARILVRGIAFQTDDKKIQIERGDKDGEVHTLHGNYGMSKDSLERLVESTFSLFKTDGYKGDFRTFGLPYIEHNYIADIIEPEYPERNGKYVVDRVRTAFGMDGFRRTLDLGIKVNE